MSAPLSHHDIYDATLDDALFESLPARMAQEVNVHSALFIWVHPGEYREITVGTQPDANPYYAEVMREDPWMAAATPEKIGRGFFRLSNEVAPEDFEKSVMYNEFIVENRLDRYWCLGMLHATRDGQVATALHKGKNAGDFTDIELQTVNRFSQDLGRLHAIRRELHSNGIAQVLAADRSLLDDAPIFELDHDGRLLRMNGMAEALFRLHPVLVLNFRRFLGLRGQGAEAFRRAIGMATAADRAESAMLELPATRGVDGRLLPRLRLNLLPRNNGGRRVMVIVTAADEGVLAGALAQPQEAVQLSRREREVLHGLVRGLRRDQLAHALSIAMPTVDLHSANLRRKLGARTIAEAIAIAANLGLF